MKEQVTAGAARGLPARAQTTGQTIMADFGFITELYVQKQISNKTFNVKTTVHSNN